MFLLERSVLFSDLAGCYTDVMRAVRIFAVVLLLVLWGVLPALACLLPQRALTPSEMKCCAQMAGNCSGKMQTSHSCCKPAADAGSAMLTAANHVKPISMALLVTPFSADSSPLGVHSIIRDWQVHPPPESPPALTTVLRI